MPSHFSSIKNSIFKMSLLPFIVENLNLKVQESNSVHKLVVRIEAPTGTLNFMVWRLSLSTTGIYSGKTTIP